MRIKSSLCCNKKRVKKLSLKPVFERKICYQLNKFLYEYCTSHETVHELFALTKFTSYMRKLLRAVITL